MLSQFYTVLVAISIALIVFTTETAEAENNNPKMLPFQTVDHGTYSGIGEPLTKVIRTTSEMTEFWKRHKGSRSPPPAPVTAIDFENEMVICVFWGMQSTGGYSLDITEVSSSGDGEIVVTYNKIAPGPNAMVTMALTQPFHIIKTSSSSKLPVRFVGVETNPPKPPPTFIVTLKDKREVNDVMEKIKALDNVVSLQLLKGLSMIIVKFKDVVEEEEAKEALERIEGVESATPDM